jgi:hypothetical protein
MMKTFKEYGSAGWQERCSAIEDTSTADFLKLCASNGWGVRKASEAQDKTQHIDYILNVAGREVTVDVKGRKKFSDRGLLLIEILNVIGNRGWLLGKAEQIAFQLQKGWLIVDRNALFRLVKDKMGLYVSTKGGISVTAERGKQVSSLPCLAPSWYCRPERPKEMVTYLTINDIVSGIKGAQEIMA